jgi:DNA-binding transcriptional LysR family regulator
MADRRLQVFYTVARVLSFTKASEALHMTQPAVTFQIRALEDYFNTKLFDRARNKISLTKTGEEVFAYAEQILGLYKEMDNRVRNLTSHSTGVLVIGASMTIGEHKIPRLLGEFQRKFPDVRVRLKVANTINIVHMVETNEVDVGIVEAPVSNKNMVVRACWCDQLMVICPPDHELAAAKSVEPEQLKNYPLISREEGSGTRSVIAGYVEQQGLELGDLQISMELGSPEAIKSAVKAGLGISVISEASLTKELKLESLRAIPLHPPLKRPLSIVYQRQQFRLRAMEKFLDFTESCCDDF